MESAEVGQPFEAATPIPVGVLCPDCGYDVRELTSARCPECGFELDVLRTRESQIPWTHRRELGRFRAYWKTVWLVTFHAKRFCLEMARPVSYADSQSFRWVTTVHAYLPVLAASMAVLILAPIRGWRQPDVHLWVHLGLQLLVLLFLAAAPGLASYFFQSRQFSVEQENRAIALSYYAWAPLAWSPFALVLFGGALVTWDGPGVTDLLFLFASTGLYTIALGVAEQLVCDFLGHLRHLRWFARLQRMTLLGVLQLGLVFLLALALLSPFLLSVVVASFQ